MRQKDSKQGGVLLTNGDAMNNLKLIFDNSIGDRFNINKLYNKSIIEFNQIPEISDSLASIKSKIQNNNLFIYILKGLIRNTFFIELTNDYVGSTKMTCRWKRFEAGGKKLEAFNESDPRYCSFEGCIDIFKNLSEELEKVSDVEKNKNFLNLFLKNNLIPYELPIDYFDLASINDSTVSLHTRDNLRWFWDDRYIKILRLREFLLSSANPLQTIFVNILTDKIKVKIYLTDRVQTGPHKTNREKRWEVPPGSVHFAPRRTCLEIEYKLINQLLHFAGIPTELLNALEVNNLIMPDRELFKCPVTYEALSFDDLVSESQNHDHGRSRLQVGHLNPLKRNNSIGTIGHSQENISWVSEEGNRIQGYYTIDETRNLIKKIYKNYEKYGV